MHHCSPFVPEFDSNRLEIADYRMEHMEAVDSMVVAAAAAAAAVAVAVAVVVSNSVVVAVVVPRGMVPVVDTGSSWMMGVAIDRVVAVVVVVAAAAAVDDGEEMVQESRCKHYCRCCRCRCCSWSD